MPKNWSSTLRLPKSTFPPRPPQHLQTQYLQRCADDLYQWQAANRPADNTFVLHDGPPFANGSLHAGHALNKILKDMIIRVKVQQGRRVSYVPGWDCHGLPIENKVLGTAGVTDMAPLEIRRAARSLAADAVRGQMASFRSYGVMADWEKRWTTMDPAYEVRQLQLFRRMVRRGLIYRRFKPVYWSPSLGTALAEAELEYNEDHVSMAAYVRFPVAGDYSRFVSVGNMVDFEPGSLPKLYALVWTTTPWTLPANQAIAVHDEVDYVIVRTGQVAVIVAEQKLASLTEGQILSEVSVMGRCKGADLKSFTYINKLQGRRAKPQPIIHGSFVTAGSGSGLVHSAPGHGFDDYLVCQELGIPLSAPVDGSGRFTAEAYPDDPRRLEGKSVLDDASDAVLELLDQDVLDVHMYRHKYPYDWRTKKPVIMRATAQWFADVESIKEKALGALQEVRFVPEAGKARLEAFVKGRSEWCISRQRAWGVPIPALYDAKGDAVMTDESVEHIISLIRERGTDAWWSDDAHDTAWVPRSLRGVSQYTRGTDTMDVWFDSGSSWSQQERQADVYLEGSDQHRGWFQSSLLTRVAAMVDTERPEHTFSLGLAPYKTLVTHGFTLDEKGKKMSKSQGNVISADGVMDGSLLRPRLPPKRNKNKAGPISNALGPDALRLWVASSDYTGDVVLGDAVLQAVHQNLIKYRTMIKMLTGSLHATSMETEYTRLDHIAILQLSDSMDEVMRHYDKFEFNKAFSTLNRWLTNDVSAFYLEALKDRLYCGDGGGVLVPILLGLLRMLAPITPLLVEEAWDHVPAWLKDLPGCDSPLRQPYSSPLVDAARLPGNEAELRAALPALAAAHAAIRAVSEEARAQKTMGSSLQCRVLLDVPPGSLDPFGLDELAAMFVVSEVRLGADLPADASDWGFSKAFEMPGRNGAPAVDAMAWVVPPSRAKCPRCWRYVADTEHELCGRCEHVVGSM